MHRKLNEQPRRSSHGTPLLVALSGSTSVALMRPSLWQKAAPPPFSLVSRTNRDAGGAVVQNLIIEVSDLKRRQQNAVELKTCIAARYALSVSGVSCRLRRHGPSAVSSLLFATRSHKGGLSSSRGHTSLSTSLRSWCFPATALRAPSPSPPSPTTRPSSVRSSSSTTLSTTNNSRDDLKEVVCACIPRAPLCAKVTAVQYLVLQYESAHPIWGPLSHVDRQKSGDEEPTQRQPLQQQQRGLNETAWSRSRSPEASSAHVSEPRYALSNEGRLRCIRASYGSFREMLISMAQERLGSDKLAREHRATAAGSRNAAAAEEEVYRGGGRYGIYLSVDLVFVTIASSALEAGRAFRNAYVPLSEQDLVYMRNALPAMDKETSRQQLPQRSATETQPLSVESTVNVTGDNDTEDLDEENVVDPAIYCYPFFPGWGVHLTERARAAQTESKVLSQTLQLRSAKNGDTLIETYIPYFGDDFIPPPPPTEFVAGPAQGSCSSSSSNSRNPSTSSPSAGKDAAPTGVPAVEPSTSTFTPQQIEALLPTYFVPMDAFLAQLPAGYTADHVRAVFSETKAVETVQLGGNTFIRFHGGRDGEGFSKTMLHDQQRRLDFVEPYDAATASSALEKHRPSSSTRGEEEEAQLRRGIAAFKPDPFLLYAFLPLFTRPFQWLPLYDVVQHAPAAVQNKLLPLRAQLTLLYFAQQQQRVQFTPQNGGGVALCGPPTRSLRPETTPLPRVLAELCVLISNRGVVYVEELENDAGQLLSDYAKRHIIAYFGTLRRFLFQHEASFRLSVFTSPTTLYEAGAATGEKEAGTGSEQRALGAQGPASLPTSSPAQTSPSPAAAATADNTPRDGKEANDRHHTTETALPPRPGAGFITNAPPQFLHFSASNFPPHEGGSSDAAASPSDSAADALRQGVVHTPNISRDEAQLDVEGFPRWLASRDLAVQLEKEAKLHDRHMESLTEQLEVVERSNSRKGRKLRRRLAAIVNPNSPFSDPAVLLDAILRYLPPTRHVSLKALLAALPTSMSDFLPNDPVRLFRNSPDKVQLFEYRRKNHLRVMRPGLPLPDGRLRASYTEEELLHLIAAQLPPGQGMYSNALYGNLPYGAREAIRLRHHHLVTLVERYPQYFVVVFSDAAKEAKHRARVSLLRPPPAPRDWSANDVAFESALTAEELESVEKADRAVLLAELPPELLRDTPASRSAAQGREPESEEQN